MGRQAQRRRCVQHRVLQDGGKLTRARLSSLRVTSQQITQSLTPTFSSSVTSYSAAGTLSDLNRIAVTAIAKGYSGDTLRARYYIPGGSTPTNWSSGSTMPSSGETMWMYNWTGTGTYVIEVETSNSNGSTVYTINFTVEGASN